MILDSILFLTALEQYRRRIAAILGVPYEYLAQKWAGGFNPGRHLFDRNGSHIWAPEMWLRVGDCYYFWHLTIPRRVVWREIYARVRVTNDWKVNTPFLHDIRQRVRDACI